MQVEVSSTLNLDLVNGIFLLKVYLTIVALFRLQLIHYCENI